MFLHDRAVPRTRGNIDHIAVGDSTVWVIDAKAWMGRVAARHVGGLFSGSEHLYVGGRNRQKAVEGLSWQVEAVMEALAGAGPLVTLRPALCIVGAEWSWFAKPLTFGDVLVVWPTKLAKMLASNKTADPSRRDEIAKKLSAALPLKR